MEILSGKQNKALKVAIYGPEGIGKSTLAAAFPQPLFIDTEGSTKFMDVRRFKKPESWTELLEQVKHVRGTPGLCSTLILDTADWAEQLCISGICASKKLSGIEDMGYGKGYVYLAEEFGKFLNLLEEVVDRGINVVLTAHAMMRKFEQPDEMGAYDRWELKLQKKTAPLVKEWSDLLLFANYKTMSVATDDKGKKFKAQGGRRVMYTSHHPCWDAKNRLGLPEELPLDFAALAQYIPGPAVPSALVPPPQPPAPQAAPEPQAPPPDPAPAPKPQTARPAGIAPGSDVPAVLWPLMNHSKVTEDELRAVIAKKGYYTRDMPWTVMEEAGFVNGWIIPFWNRIVEIIESDPDRLPS